MAKNFSIGDVIQLPVGLKVRHNQGNEVTTIQVPVTVVVESTWPVEGGIGGTNHFEDGQMVAARALHEDGSYHKEGALLTFALSGDFRSEFLLPEANQVVLRKMQKTFLPPA